jgi:hypothetical protein
MGYTWEEVLSESLPRTLYSLERLQEEAERKQEQKNDIDKKTRKAKTP